MTQKNWTPEEIEILRQNYVSGGTRTCANLLPGRTFGSIQTKAKHLKLSFDVVRDYSENGRTGCWDERELIVGEVRYLIDLTLYNKEKERVRAHKLLNVIIKKNTPEWWHARREWALGRWLEALIRDYDWTTERETYKQRVRELKEMILLGSFEDAL